MAEQTSKWTWPASSAATFDVTSECPQRCRHCYLYGSGGEADALGDELYLSRLESLRDAHAIRSAMWVGGEPLLRPALLKRAMALFARNAVITSGAVPIPEGLDAGLVVSLEGFEAEHDCLRGKGAFSRALQHLAPLPAGSFALNTTLTRPTLGAIADLPRLVEQSRAAGVVVGFFTGPTRSPLRVSLAERHRAVDALRLLRATHPNVLLMSAAAIEQLRPGSALGPLCPYQRGALAFDSLLRPRLPCTFGANADCDACGCPLIALRVAMDGGDADSRATLEVVFPHARGTGTAQLSA